MSKVYVQTDEQNRIVAVNSSAFLANTTDWIQIDEGEGDKYHHAQGNYFSKPIYTNEYIPCYKLTDGVPIERTQAEIDTDIAARPTPPPSETEQIRTRVGELEAVIDALIGGEAA